MVLDRTDASGLSSAVVGRADELMTLNAYAEAACDGRSGLVILSGPAGIGKTSLLRAFLDGGPGRSMTVLHGTCAETAAGAGYGGVRALFGPLGLCAEDAGDSPLLRGTARRALPALTAGPAAEPPSDAAAVYAVLHGLYWLAANLMTDGPLALVLDDAHWCDERSLRWLDFLLRRADGLPLLVVLAHRTETRPVALAALEDITAQCRPALLHLTPLTPTDVGQIVREVFPTPAHASFTARATAVTGGNPRLLTRLLHALRAEGVPPDERGAHRVADVGGQVIAGSLRGLLARQPGWVGDVAGAIAVLGETSPERIAALTAVPAQRVAEAVTVLRRADVVAPDRLDLAHDAVRTAVLGSLGDRAGADLRVRAALLLSDLGRPAEEVADQLLLVPDLGQPWMTAVLRDAAARAPARGAPDAAVRYLRRLLRSEPDSLPVRIQLARSLAETDPVETLALLRQALVPSAGLRTRAVVAVQYAMVCLTGPEAPSAVRILTAIVDELAAKEEPGTGDRELRTLVESALLIAGSARKETIAAARDRAAQLPVPPGDTPAQCQLLAMMTVLTAIEGHSVQRTVDLARRALRFPGVAPGGWSQLGSAFALNLADEPEEALAALDRLLRYGRENAADRTHVLALSHRALVLHGLGALPDALSAARSAVDAIDQGKWRGYQVVPQIALATVLTDRGEPERAERLLGDLEGRNLDGFAIDYPWYLMARARARRALGDSAAALGLLRDCGRSLDDAGITNAAFVPWWAEAACLLAELNRHDEARECAAHGTALARRWGTPRALGLAAVARGVSTIGRAGLGPLTEAAETLADSPARGEQARAEYLLGRALLAAGEQLGARVRLRTAAGLAQRCGALPLGRAARRALLTAGGRMREITGSPVDLLTGRERKIAALAAAGVSNRTIAESLFITVRTVEMHLTGVYRKLGVSQRTDLAAILHAAGIRTEHPAEAAEPRVARAAPGRTEQDGVHGERAR
ncbi:helix-turn-helix transcriptional regulator [Streptomyces celluloflavus]|uniref:helix-turn-helix transcriptional regulator n=1 Tax=Streptomyces celluloflavus TaxID=58344 RepID=UPI0036A02072